VNVKVPSKKRGSIWKSLNFTKGSHVLITILDSQIYRAYRNCSAKSTFWTCFGLCLSLTPRGDLDVSGVGLTDS
jgi:hypothetical protein